jgi:hypothetical protein
MSALGQKQTFNDGCPMSALPPKADIAGRPQSAAPRLWSATLLASGTSATLSFGFPALGFAADLLHFHRLAKTQPWYK